MAKDNRCVIEVFEGIEVRKSNVVRFRFSANKYKELISEVKKTGLSIPKLISISGRPCEKCKGIEVVSRNYDGKEVSVKRGIISDYTMCDSGSNILNK